MINQDLVAKQYEEYVYPLPIQDLDADAASGHYEMLDPFFFRRKYWPKNVEPQDLNILIAGCGTSQAARIAYRNKNCRVVGIDISKSSLGHQLYLKNKHSLANLEVHQLEIENVEKLNKQFDLIISTGVLHHRKVPNDRSDSFEKSTPTSRGNGNHALRASTLGVGVYMMQEVFKTLKFEQNPSCIEKIKKTLTTLPKWHYLRRYLEMSEDLYYDSE
jgi:SAM-dependent methyltransferase